MGTDERIQQIYGDIDACRHAILEAEGTPAAAEAESIECPAESRFARERREIRYGTRRRMP